MTPVDNRLSVCYIDNDPVDLEVIERIIGKQVAFHTAESLEVLEASDTDYDVILLDLGLCTSNGIETVKQYFCKFDDKTPVVAISGKGDEELRLDAIRCGAVDFIDKGKISEPEIFMRIFKRAIALKNHKPNRRYKKSRILESLTNMQLSQDKTIGYLS